MRVKLLVLRKSADDQQSRYQGGSGNARLWHIGVSLALSFTVAVLGLAGLAGLAWLLLGLGGFRPHGTPPLHDTVSVLQLVFASVAGAGALVALVVAYRRQKVAEADSAHDRVRVFNERFIAIATQLGDEQPAVRLAGVHAMAGLADDWKANRQTCVDVLCAYLRMPYEPDPGEQVPAKERLASRANREVRHTVIRVITAHLKDDAAVSWQGQNFDFTGVVFDGGNLSDAVFSGGEVSFSGAAFAAGEVNFSGVRFSGGRVSFSGAEFSGGEVNFSSVRFAGGEVNFSGVRFSGGRVNFSDAEFSGGEVSFYNAEFVSGEVSFSSAEFSGGEVSFMDAEFSGCEVSFMDADFSGGEVSFSRAYFSRREVDFSGAEFFGAKVDFRGAHFSREEVSFDGAVDWSCPPVFDAGKGPAGRPLPL